LNQVDFFGLKISNFTIDELHEYYDQTIFNSETIICFGYSFETIPNFKKYPDLYNIINNFDVSVTDGTWFYWFMKFLGFKLKTFLSIPFMSIDALNYANTHKKSVLLLGGDEVTNKTAISNLKKEYSNIHFFDGRDGFFKQEEETDVVQYINNCKPNILLIGISSPKKERFAERYKYQLSTNIIIPCGGMIDIFAGKVILASPFFKKIGLATLIRLIQEPVRLFPRVLLLSYETICKIIPITIWQSKIKKNNNFRIPSIYNNVK
jgi:N-acetylglucosaminyldiphosphoundecaprenol N-acetyl-beta-D-mannosaminyltransferase